MLERIDGRAVLPNFEMQLRPALRTEAHLRDDLTGLDILSLGDDEALVVTVRAQEAVVVVDDHELPIGLQAAAGVDDSTGRRGADVLTDLSADADTIR